jgi:prepilin signal peptidase PulO-like enzyme (type II secretory pathway)
MIVLAIWAGVVGLAVGSFVGVVAWRVPRGHSVVHPPSQCPVCGYQLAWYDNVPLLSYAVLRGRCRRCRAPIGLGTLAVEAGTGLLFGLGVMAEGRHWALVGVLVAVATAVADAAAVLGGGWVPGMALGGGLIGLVAVLVADAAGGPGGQPTGATIAGAVAAIAAGTVTVGLVGRVGERRRAGRRRVTPGNDDQGPIDPVGDGQGRADRGRAVRGRADQGCDGQVADGHRGATGRRWVVLLDTAALLVPVAVVVGTLGGTATWCAAVGAGVPGAAVGVLSRRRSRTADAAEAEPGAGGSRPAATVTGPLASAAEPTGSVPAAEARAMAAGAVLAVTAAVAATVIAGR